MRRVIGALALAISMAAAASVQAANYHGNITGTCGTVKGVEVDIP